MTRLACLFLGHLFNAAEWEVESKTNVGVRPLGVTYYVPQGVECVYKNTCLRCGDLVFRRVKSLE